MRKRLIDTRTREDENLTIWSHAKHGRISVFDVILFLLISYQNGTNTERDGMIYTPYKYFH